jgi:AP-4 complex subunit epsilon-1
MSVVKDNVQNKDFFEFVKAIGESKSKQEEDRIIIDEVASLKRKVSSGNPSACPILLLVSSALYNSLQYNAFPYQPLTSPYTHAHTLI